LQIVLNNLPFKAGLTGCEGFGGRPKTAMSGTTSKKVVVYRFDREALPGFVHPQTWLGPAGVELLTPTGAVSVLPYGDIKCVCYVREWEADGWRQERRLFGSRPKTEGLWVRALFRDNDFIEGVLPNDLLATEPQGYLLAPPDAFSNSQRVFVPRAALKEFKVMGVVGSPAHSRRAKAAAKPEGQIGLFE
jgi:hypothetical protein